MELSTTQAVLSAVAGGHGLGWVSSLALAGRTRERVEAVRLADLTLRRPLYLVTTRAGAALAVAAAFTAWVREWRQQTVSESEARESGFSRVGKANALERNTPAVR
jgi:DNA-binding transcriptional LysR family regulator